MDSGILDHSTMLSKLKHLCETARDDVLTEMIEALEPRLTSEDTPLLAYFRTRPQVELHFPGVLDALTPSRVPSEELFRELCGAADGRFVACCALFDVLKVWSELRREEKWAMMLLEQIAR